MYIFSCFLRSALWLVLAGYGLTQQSPFCPNANGDFPNPASETCASFFRCVQGRPLALRCPRGEAFDYLLRRCSPEDDVSCERQLQLFATPAAAGGSSDWFLGGANGLGSFFPFPSGNSDSNQNSFLNGLPQGVYDHLFKQADSNSQSVPQGQNGLNLPNPFAPGASGWNLDSLGQGNQGQGQFPQAQGSGAFAGVLGPGTGISVTSDGQLTAGGKAIGKVYSTAQGTVIVIAKEPGQQAATIPNIQKLNTVPISKQNQPQPLPATSQQPTPSGNQAANQRGQNAASQDSGANQVRSSVYADKGPAQSQSDTLSQNSRAYQGHSNVYANQGSAQSQSDAFRPTLDQGNGPLSPSVPLFVNNLNNDVSDIDSDIDINSVSSSSGSDSN